MYATGFRFDVWAWRLRKTALHAIGYEFIDVLQANLWCGEDFPPPPIGKNRPEWFDDKV
jgi:hypothetical protein